MTKQSKSGSDNPLRGVMKGMGVRFIDVDSSEVAKAGSPKAALDAALRNDHVVRAQDAKRRQRQRSIAIALSLGAMSLLFYAATIVRMGANVVNRPLAVLGSSIIGSVLR